MSDEYAFTNLATVGVPFDDWERAEYASEGTRVRTCPHIRYLVDPAARDLSTYFRV